MSLPFLQREIWDVTLRTNTREVTGEMLEATFGLLRRAHLGFFRHDSAIHAPAEILP